MIAILDRNLNVTGRIMPEKQPLNLEERKSTTTITLSMDDPDLNFGAWLRDETEPGAGIIWRVKSGGTQYEKKTRTIQLEHIINTLRDVLIFGELTPAGITGNRNATTCTAREAVVKILSYQNIWALGDFEYSVSNPYSFNGDNLYSALETVTASLEEAYWDYDLTRLPFRLHIRRLPAEASCEMREGRNIQTLNKTIDGSRMYTRFYPIGQNNIHISGEYVSRNEEIYGTICKTETDQSKKTEAALRAWANDRLRNHCEPSVTVQISGMDLSEATGEPLDRLTINRKCRVPLPEYGTVITEKITKLSWADKIREPEKVNATLANLIEDVATIISNSNKASARGGRAAAKDAEEKHAWLIDENDHVGLLAEAVAGEGADRDWSRVSSVIVDGQGIHQRVQKAQGDIIAAYTQIDANENRILLEAQRATAAEGVLSGRITVEADKITQEVTDRTNADAGLSGRITTESNRISLVVEGTGANAKIKPAQIVTAINNASSSVLLSADKIRLDGNTTVSGMLGIENGGLKVKGNAFINGDLTMASGKEIFAGAVRATDIRFPGSNPGADLHLTRTDVAAMLISASVDGNVLTITDKSGNEVTFSKATSLSDAWSGNTYTVTAKQNGVTVGTKSTSPFVQPVTSQGGAYVDLYVATGSSGGQGYETHGDVKKLYLVKSGLTVYLKNENSASSGTVYAQTTCSNPYPTSMAIRQVSGYASARKMKLYYQDNLGGYHECAGGSQYWYYSGTDLNQTGSNKTVHY